MIKGRQLLHAIEQREPAQRKVDRAIYQNRIEGLVVYIGACIDKHLRKTLTLDSIFKLLVLVADIFLSFGGGQQCI
ncbi:hypothetical protein D1872_316000 [compost metagenome]